MFCVSKLPKTRMRSPTERIRYTPAADQNTIKYPDLKTLRHIAIRRCSKL
jgi:hypothetical protein